MPFDGARLSQTASDLVGARNILVNQGWQPNAGRHGGPHCPVTALMEASGYEVTSIYSVLRAAASPRFRLAYRLLRESLPEGNKHFLAVPVWNVVQKSGGPALQLFDRAISHAITV
jgi:hypothetical protein